MVFVGKRAHLLGDDAHLAGRAALVVGASSVTAVLAEGGTEVKT
jgi:hypothetical protein